jgi:hypothetical protein
MPRSFRRVNGAASPVEVMIVTYLARMESRETVYFSDTYDHFVEPAGDG